MRWLPYVFLFFSFSCTSPDDVPKKILPVNKMRTVLWEVMQADEAVNYYYLRDTSLNRAKKAEELYQKVLVMHNISYEEFNKSFGYYQSRPDLLKQILDSMHKTALLPDTLYRREVQ